MKAIIDLLSKFGALTAVPSGLCVFNPTNVDINQLKQLVKALPNCSVIYQPTEEFSKELNKQVEPFIWVGKNSSIVDTATANDHLASSLG